MASEPRESFRTEISAPAAVEMPRPTAAPFVVAFGITLVASALVLGLVFLAVGVAVLVAGMGIWISKFLQGRGHMEETIPEASQHAQPPEGSSGGVEQLREGLPGYRFRLPLKVHPVSAGIKGGIVGGIVMPVPALLWSLYTGHGIWYPLNLLAGMVLPGVGTMASAELEQFHLSLLLPGLSIHIFLSIIVGLIYGVLLPTLPPVPRPIAWGGLLMPILWSGASYIVVNVVNPLLAPEVNWPWFVVSQFVFGITMPAVVLAARRLNPVLAGAMGGLAGAAAMAVLALLWAAASEHTFWHPINLLAGMVLPGQERVDVSQLESFRSDWLVVAGGVHVAVSIVFGVLFALLIPRLPHIPGPISWGAMVAPLAWTGLSYSLMGVVNKPLQVNVNWPWFIVSQFVFGVVAAIVVLRSEIIQVPPAGPGPGREAATAIREEGDRS
jgi:hypothetical protein